MVLNRDGYDPIRASTIRSPPDPSSLGGMLRSARDRHDLENSRSAQLGKIWGEIVLGSARLLGECNSRCSN